MPYTLGAAHALTGSGQVALSAPAGLKIAVTNRPSYLGNITGDPLEYFDLGHIALGNADGFLPPQPLTHLQELRYPIPDGLTRLGFSLGPGVQATATELMPVAAVTSPDPVWKRNPLVVRGQYVTSVNANTAQTQVYSYTVPANRRLQLAHCRVSVKGWFASTGGGYAQAWVYLNGGVLVLAVSNDPAVTSYVWDSLGSPLFLPAGATLTAHVLNAWTTGTVYVTIVLAGVEFDA